jgi:hypothetical protein
LLKSQLLIITAVGYYKLIKDIPVTADPCNKGGRLGFSVPYPDERKNPRQLNIFLSYSIGTGLAARDLIRNGGQVVILLVLALVEEAVIFCSQGLGLL